MSQAKAKAHKESEVRVRDRWQYMTKKENTIAPAKSGDALITFSGAYANREGLILSWARKGDLVIVKDLTTGKLTLMPAPGDELWDE